MSTYNLLDDTPVTVNRNHVRILYYNMFCSSLIFIVIFIIGIEIDPLVKNASVLLDDASQSLNDFNVLLPEVKSLIPEARNSTKMLGRLTPEIVRGLRILVQLCTIDPECSM